ncbi:hypothetical protein ZWY2020_037566 [Hordeum vulgare]|nr:hypothetical protein ZWY2020_037562 [Hordeum vulgare]KAI5017188.1 hypothetical protein ZWY2020_037566 [Hordeum vulgare]
MERKVSKAKTMSKSEPELKTYSATGSKGNPHVQPAASSSEAKAKASSTAALPTPAPSRKHAKPANPGSIATKP